MSTYHAQPYNTAATGFYFEDLDDYQTKVEACRSLGRAVEEFSVQFIDGDDGEAVLFSALGIDQSNLDTWFEVLDEVTDGRDRIALFWLVNEAGYSLDDARGKIDDVSMIEGTLIQAATEQFDQCYDVPAAVQPYIDYEAYSRDCEMGGEMTEVEFCGKTWTVTNANGI